MAECPDCGDTFKNEHGMKVHRSRVHRSGSVELECEHCGDDFEVKRARKDTARFCSQECMGAWRAKNKSGENSPLWKDITAECAQCGDEFQTTNHDNERCERRFCSKDCYSQWMSENQHGENHHQYDRVTLECEECGSPFNVIPAVAEYRRNCSQECRTKQMKREYSGENHPQYQGGHVEWRGPNWIDQREKALERDDYQCRRCGRDSDDIGRNPHVHHRLKIRFFKERYDEPEWYELGNDLENLITLCPTCHRTFENMPVQPEA